MLTPLQAAAYHGNAENVRLLLDHGALLNTAPLGIYGNELQGNNYWYGLPLILANV